MIKAKEEVAALIKIAKSSAFNSYPNLAEFTKIVYDTAETEDIKTLLKSHNHLYEKVQAKFLSKFYSKIKVSNLKRFVGKIRL